MIAGKDIASARSIGQLCIEAGAAAAVSFFDERTSLGLHDHIAASMHCFMQSLRALQTATSGAAPIATQTCTDAFAAGYLGRIQQELRLFRNEGSASAKGRPYAVH